MNERKKVIKLYTPPVISHIRSGRFIEFLDLFIFMQCNATDPFIYIFMLKHETDAKYTQEKRTNTHTHVPENKQCFFLYSVPYRRNITHAHEKKSTRLLDATKMSASSPDSVFFAPTNDSNEETIFLSCSRSYLSVSAI